MESGARLRVSETKLTVRHFDVTNMSHYVIPRGSSWLPAPSACAPAVSGTPSRPPPARDPGTNEHRSAPRDRHHGAEQPPSSRLLLLLQLHGSEVSSVGVDLTISSTSLGLPRAALALVKLQHLEERISEQDLPLVLDVGQLSGQVFFVHTHTAFVDGSIQHSSELEEVVFGKTDATMHEYLFLSTRLEHTGRTDLGAGPPSRPGCRTTRGCPQRRWRSRRCRRTFSGRRPGVLRPAR